MKARLSLLQKLSKVSWSEESRENQRQQIRIHKPWKHSTGAKTADGKKMSSQNADKGKGELRSIRKQISKLHKERLKITRSLKEKYNIILPK